MDFYEAIEFFKGMFPDKQITYEFDDKCQRSLEIIHTDGLPNVVHHIECNKVKINIDGIPPQYVPIKPHRLGCSWASIKKMVNDKKDVHFNEEQLKELSEENVSQFSEYTGLSREDLLAKKQNIKSQV